MKTMLRNVLFLGLLTTILISCSSDDDDDMSAQIPDPQPSEVTYSTIAVIMNGNCTSCHGTTPTNGAPMSLTTYSNVREAVENRELIIRIENGSMPPNGSLTSMQIQDIKSWRDQGFPQ